MKLSYLILAHKNLHHVDRMIKLLQHDHAEFYIHVDAKVETNEIRKYQFYNTPGITIIKKRYRVTWGGYNMVRATISLMKAACKKREPGYLILMSGQDFPIKSSGFIYNFLKEDYGREYLEHFPLPDPRWNLNAGLDRIKYYWFMDTIGPKGSGILYQMQKDNIEGRKFFEEFTPYGGSQWWCITDECAAYILKFLRQNPIYEEYFEHTFIPDEVFFNTLVLNSPFKINTTNNNLKYITTKKGENVFPSILTIDDWEILMESECLWARKFTDEKSSAILDRLESLQNLP